MVLNTFQGHKNNVWALNNYFDICNMESNRIGTEKKIYLDF